MINKGKAKTPENNSEQYIPGQWFNTMKMLENNPWLELQMTLINKQIQFLNTFANSMCSYFNSANKLLDKWIELPTTNIVQENINNIAKSMNLPTNSAILPLLGKAIFEPTTDMDPMQTILDIVQSPLITTTKPKSKKKNKK
ncbi:Uncharacterised protein [Legionella donaldsonii]|uniref:Uncharacterized protein n=1 Tax=Legionella donaldsonii TaxID=45060 RepID=A0A378J6Z3_9GAMM|nr:hypothetical protein [Legionella donaldsonii]STX43219.1 Uncharacterised protein [Legionella donaldsonii]